MKYLIVGTGGTGGAIGGFLAAGGRDVAFIARGEHLRAIQKNGLTVHSDRRGELRIPDARATDMEGYQGRPDVVFVCVKGYSLPQTIPFLRRVAGEGAVVIPILNIYGTGGKIAEQVPGPLVTDGCMYIVSYVSAPGEITQSGQIFRVLFGTRDGSRPAVLEKIADDLRQCGIDAVVSEDIRRDAFQKFSCVSSMAAAGAYFDAATGEVCADPEKRALYVALVREIAAVARAMGIVFTVDLVEENLKVMDKLAPQSTASMQKDLKKGKQSEMDGLIFEVVRMGGKYGVPVPAYRKIAEHFGYSGGL